MEAGLEIVFASALDGGIWPGEAEFASSTCGRVWVGPQGLLARLELELGLGSPRTNDLERAVELTPHLEKSSGYWRRSLEIDPVATSRRLLGDRDLLAMWGWSGEPVSERLDTLWSSASVARPGIPDRLKAVISMLEQRGVEIARIDLGDSLDDLAPLWQRTLIALRNSGVEITERPPTAIGKPRLQLLRSYGALAAAIELAATLAAIPDLSSTIVIGADSILDDALRAFGVPVVGGDRTSPASAGLLRAVVETAFHPVDLDEVYALLMADPGPIPRVIARNLVDSLRRLGGRGSAAWNAAIEDGLATLEPGSRVALRSRVSLLLDAAVPRGDMLAIGLLELRAEALAGWARARSTDVPTLGELARRADQLVRLARLRCRERFSRSELLQLCGELEEVTIDGADPEAGLPYVRAPGAVLGSVRHAIWWGFTRDRAPQVQRLRLSVEERIALRSVGATPPPWDRMMAFEARQWRRPLDRATENLILVCPRTDAVGDPAHPHPLWDEIVAALPDSVAERDLHVSELTFGDTRARRVRATSRAVPEAQSIVHAPRPVALRGKESASSLELLVGCSLAYALTYSGKVRSRVEAPPLHPSPLLFGMLAHHVLARVFSSGVPAPEAASRAAAEIMDSSLPLLAETLLLPDHQGDLAMVHGAIVDAAGGLASLLGTGSNSATEVTLAGTIDALTVEGRSDVVVGDGEIVVDLKWGSSASRDQLASGTAVQLAIYAELVRRERPGPASVGFYAVRDQRLLVPPGSRLAGRVHGVHAVDETLDAFRRALRLRVDELERAELSAPGAIEDRGRSRLVGGTLELTPPCTYCTLDGVCGRRFRA